DCPRVPGWPPFRGVLHARATPSPWKAMALPLSNAPPGSTRPLSRSRSRREYCLKHVREDIMNNRAFSLAGALVALAASTSVGLAFEDGAIVIWQDDRAPDLLTEIGAQFEADLGIRVVVENVDPLTDRFQQAAATGDGPDIVMWAHDRLGEWAAGGLISPVTPSASIVEGILPSAMEAVSFGGNVWGYPVAVEAIGLVYNKALVE